MALENNQIENSNINNDSISLKQFVFKIKEWVVFLFSKWKIIILIGLIGAIIGYTYAKYSKITYKAVLSFAMDEDKPGGGLGSALGLASSLGITSSGGGGIFTSNNLTQLMKSRLVVEKTLLKPILINGKKSTLAEYYIEINNIRKSWNDKPILKSISFLLSRDSVKYTRQQDSILQTIFSALATKQSLLIDQKDKKFTIFNLEVTNENELFAKLFCESLANETSNFYVQTINKKSRLNVSILQKQVDSVKSQLTNSINGIANEADNIYNLNPAYNKKTAISKNKQVDLQTNSAILTNLVVQLELAKINLRKETPLIQEIDHPTLPLEKEKLSKLKYMILGSFLGGFLTIVFLIIHELYKKMML